MAIEMRAVPYQRVRLLVDLPGWGVGSGGVFQGPPDQATWVAAGCVGYVTDEEEILEVCIGQRLRGDDPDWSGEELWVYPELDQLEVAP